LDFGVPYKLCGECLAYYRLLDDDDKAQFAISLWQQGAVRCLEPGGHA
jgi:hypothetical protein